MLSFWINHVSYIEWDTGIIGSVAFKLLSTASYEYNIRLPLLISFGGHNTLGIDH